MKKFIHNILLFCIPGLLIILVYIISDPFMAIYSYDNYYQQQRIPVSLNRDHISTRTYIRYREQNHYDSFIFGNSRSLVYPVKDWKQYLNPKAMCFHFDASSETLYGIYKKMYLIDQLGDHMENALLILDPDILSKDTPIRNSHLFYPSPAIEQYKHWTGFQWIHFMTFCNPKIIFAVCDFAISGKVKDYMARNFLIKEFNIRYQLPYNEISYDSIESEIQKGNYYTKEQMTTFEGKQIKGVHPAVIKSNQYALLQNMASILKKHRSHYKIIISPLYYQQQLNPKDKNVLIHLFGKENIYDFSGINEITQDYHNYYENSHYRPCAAQYILHKVYRNETLNKQPIP